jgi:hypothetical protein
MVAHTCNPIYLRGRDWEDTNLRQTQAKVKRLYLNKTSQVWWFMPVIPAMWEVEEEHSGLRPALGINVRLYLKNY